MDVRRSSLHVRCEDCGVVPEILVKGVAVPASFRFHDVEWEAAEEVFQGGTDADGVSLQTGKFRGGCGLCQTPHECRLGQRYLLSILVPVPEKVGFLSGVIEFQVPF